jgi:LacI family transcriptional regulator
MLGRYGSSDKATTSWHRDDVAVVGFDNWDVMVTGRRPMLTSIDPDLHAVGRVAAEHLLLAIDGRPRRGVHLVAPRLVVRESTGPGIAHPPPLLPGRD